MCVFEGGRGELMALGLPGKRRLSGFQGGDIGGGWRHRPASGDVDEDESFGLGPPSV